jgi:hypothetical protein
VLRFERSLWQQNRAQSVNKKTEVKRLRKILHVRLGRGQPGQEEVLKKFRKVVGLDAEVQFLREHVHASPTPGRQPQGAKEGFGVSQGSQIKGIAVKPMRVDALVKYLDAQSLAAKRTLAVYGYLRLVGAELTAPVPKLYKAEHSGKTIEFWFEHAGGDAAHKKVLATDMYVAARQRSIDELVDLGFDKRACSHHKQNWAYTKEESGRYRAVLIDVGRVVRMFQGSRSKKQD